MTTPKTDEEKRRARENTANYRERKKKASNRSDANATLHAKETLHVVDETVKSDSGVTDENRKMSENCSDANATLHAKEILHAVEETVKSDLILSAKHCLHANESKKKE